MEHKKINNTAPQKHSWKKLCEGIWECEKCKTVARAYYAIPSWTYQLEFSNPDGHGYIHKMPDCLPQTAKAA